MGHDCLLITRCSLLLPAFTTREAIFLTRALMSDQFKFLGNQSPTPPLGQHYHLLPA